MHFFKFNIGDYSSHTNHLSESEDLAYRRMLDYCYLNEIGLPESIEEIGRLIRMRTHSDCIANVLREFFYLENGAHKNKRVEIDLFDYHSKSDKAAESAKARWAKHKEISDANALRTECEGNAKQEPLNTKQEPLNNIIVQDADAPSPLGVLITNKKGETFPVYQSDFDLWEETYQAVDVLQELKKIKAWLDANPTKRKTKTGMKKFINNWLSRAQDNPVKHQLHDSVTQTGFIERVTDRSWANGL